MPNDFHHWVLTDTVQADIWQETFLITQQQIPSHHTLPNWRISKRMLQGGKRHGVDIIEVDNGALSFSILPTRGMSIWKGKFRGMELGWKSPIRGPIHPQYVNLEARGGIGWLDGFDEWIVRCGLGWNGPPGEDQGKKLTLHGRIANQPAHFVAVRVQAGPPFAMQIIGRLQEACLFHGHLHMTTTITTFPGSNKLIIHDDVENRSAQPAELQMLYHCNFGPPLLGAGSRIAVPAHAVAPRDSRAAEYIHKHAVYEGPTRELNELVNYYMPKFDKDERTLAVLHNVAADKACALRWNKASLPWFVVWKNTDAEVDGYLTGIEPSTNFPNFKSVERQQGRVVKLTPGGTWECTLEAEMADTSESVAKLLGEVETIQDNKTMLVSREPRPEWGG